MNKFRTHTCAELNEAYIDKTVTLSGWLLEKGSWKFTFYRLKRPLWNYTMCDRK